MIEGLVSTIIPVYNRPEMLVIAVETVVRQTYRPIEIIIVDDGSSDNTLEVAQNLAKHHDFIRVKKIENSGAGIAREHGRQIANGEFIQYLDSDDLLDASKFSLQVSALQAHPHAGACYCKTSIEFSQPVERIEAWKRTGEKIDSILPSMLAGRWWGTSTPLYRRVACDAAGPWTALINEEDWEYDCRIALSYNQLCRVNQTLSTERHHDAPRLSNNGASDPTKLASRAQAHLRIVEHALNAKFDHRTHEFEHLLVACFFLARQCAEVGLVAQSKLLLSAAHKNLSVASKQRTKIRVFKACAKLLGWKTMGKLSTMFDRLRQ
jgi:glycosyltransferase involved in cell wall biosynthesis